MAEEQGFAQARTRLEEIVVQVRKKDTSLEQSLDLLEEGVRLANQCTELVDHSEWRPSNEADSKGGAEAAKSEPEVAAAAEAGAVGEEAGAGLGDNEVSDRLQDPDESLSGTDAAVTPSGVAEPEPGDEYDDIFADEE